MNPEYKVIEETGPAHKRAFTIQLTLGDMGTWEGKQQASEVLDTLQPPQFNVTPTVELNVLAMKLGKLTQYQDLQPKMPSYQTPLGMGYNGLQMQQHQLTGMHHNMQRPRSPYGIAQPGQENHYRPYIQNGYHPRSAPPRVPRICCVKLMVGDQEFYGEGRDKQKARQNAAAKAIKLMREELAAAGDKVTSNKPEEQNAFVQNGESTVSQPEGSPNDSVTEIKSEISQVYEIASKRKLQVGFEDVKSSGPPHMKRFVVSATVGEFMTVGEGCKKKDANKKQQRKCLKNYRNFLSYPKRRQTTRIPAGLFDVGLASLGNPRMPRSIHL
ncbi:Double-stranded RNA-binding protein Staufen 1 [Desmophyllum pertusum]|uniref:Double-stranded RNA-binding protein Staufen 1 n=1 Tax=Desmophyllum pertusum TaxID=174260 RepID=A0A9X0CP39_9CNID|nr:Double-stranded RNA-binding protein Staufen 1 [Desmophyllum pertusum]